jgi:YHS domain-containing protein/thioredoxin-related protein
MTTLVAASVIAHLSVHWSKADDAKAFEPIQKTLNWLGDYGEALRTAVEAKRPVWIQFTGPWCPNCHKMDRETFRNPKVIERLTKHFVIAKISCENDAELALSFGFTQLPSSVLISHDGKILARHEGFADPEKLESLTLAAGVPSEDKTQVIAEAKLLANDDSKSGSTETVLAADLVSKPTGEERETTALAMLSPVDGDAPRIAIDSDEAPVDEADKLLSEEIAVEPSQNGDAAEAQTIRQPLGKYCPVTLLEKASLVVTDGQITAVYAGARYYFASSEAKARFAEAPERFVPARGGDCLVALAESNREVAGSEHFPVVYDSRIYLCESEQAREKFLSAPAAFAGNDVRMHGLCPHCGASLAASSNQRKPFQIRFGGSRYQFPDKAHMEAFLKSPLRYLR